MEGTSFSEHEFAQFCSGLFDQNEREGSLSDQPISVADYSNPARARSARRFRNSNWTPDERQNFLEAMLEVEREKFEGSRKWEFISQRLRDGSGGTFSRSAKECENFYGTMRKALKAIISHEASLGGGPQTSDQHPRTVSYFGMDDGLRSRNKFLPYRCYELMSDIFKLQEKKKEERQQSANHAGLFHMVHSVVEGNHGTQLSLQHHVELCFAELSQRAGKSHFEKLRYRFIKVDSEELSRLLTPDLMQRVIAAIKVPVLLNVEILVSSGFRYDVDDPVAGLAPVVAKFIEDALKIFIDPLSSMLEAWEERQKERQKKKRQRQALNEKKRAIEQEEKELDESERREHVISPFTLVSRVKDTVVRQNTLSS